MKINITLEELLEAGCHFGHQVRRWNPKMASYIYGEREGIHIFDLAKTREMLLEACEAVRDVAANGGIILFVGTKRQAQDLVVQTAKDAGMPYIASRWLGGTLTNFEQINRSIKKLKEMKEKRDSGEYKEYTKLERLLIDREIGKLERVLGGISDMGKVPDMMFIVDTHEEATAVREAQRMGVPVVGITDTNSDPTKIDYPIPANDDAVKSVSYILGVIGEAVMEGKTHKQSLPLRGNVKRETKNEKSKTVAV